MAKRPQHEPSPVEPRPVGPRPPEADRSEPASPPRLPSPTYPRPAKGSAAEVRASLGLSNETLDLEVIARAVAECHKHEADGDIVGAIKSLRPSYSGGLWGSRVLASELMRVCENLLLRLAYAGHAGKTEAGFRLLQQIKSDSFSSSQSKHVNTLHSICSDLAKSLVSLNIDYSDFMIERTKTIPDLEISLRHVARSLGRTVATVREQLGIADATGETTRRGKAKPPRAKKANPELTAARLRAAFETLVRESDLANPALTEAERSRQAGNLRRTYERLRKADPTFQDSSEQLRLAQKFHNEKTYQRRKAAKLAA